ncbi:MAG: MFS transporter [Solirubrobacteraceae bacterium]|nr:MFS transporter [Solirubrobacteraceae bacterium]
MAATSHGTTDAQSPLPDNADRGRWIALYVLCTGMLMIVLDVTVVNVALPSIQTNLGFTDSNLAWVVNAYLVPFGGLLLLAGRLGDLVGRARVFKTGLAIFVTASLLCGAAQSQEWLVAARFLQGIGGGLTSAVILGAIVTMFPQPHEQARAIGVFTFVAVSGGTIGLLVGGVLTELISWHWIFLVNLPIGIATFAAALKWVPDDRDSLIDSTADVPGAVLITSSVMLAVYALVGSETYGLGSGRTLGLLAVSVALGSGFVWRQATAAHPLVRLGIFRSRNVVGANVVQALTMAGMFAIGFMSALYLQRVLGYTPLEVGASFLPATLVMAALSLKFTAPLIDRFGPRPVLIVGLLITAASLVGFARLGVESTYASVAPVMVLHGLGAGIAFPALMMLAMAGVPPQDAGLASGLVNTTQQVGGALGLAILATASASRTDSLLGDGISQAGALTGGYHLAFYAGACSVLLAAFVAATVLRPAPAPAEGEGADAPQPVLAH